MEETASDKQGFETMTSSIEHAVNYAKWIISCFCRYMGSSMLEVGTGHGNFRKYISGIEEYVSMDLDPDVIDRASTRDPEGEYVVADVTSGDFTDVAGRERFDSVLCLNVLEHIDAEKTAVENMLKVLKEGGHLLVLVPAFPSLYMDLDRLAGHHRRYTRTMLLDILPEDGCEVVKLEYFNAIGGIGWWMNKFMSHDDIDSRGVNYQVVFFDKYIVPLSRMVNGITRTFFGQSLLAVIKRR